MPQPLDPGLLEGLSADLRAVIEAQVAALSVERAARRHLEAENADLRASNAELKALNARLEHLAREFQSARFGPRSEKLSEDQLALALEDIEVAVGAAQEEHDRKVEARTDETKPRAPRRPRGLPRELPREERILAPSDCAVPAAAARWCGSARTAPSGSTSRRRSSASSSPCARSTPVPRGGPVSPRPGRRRI
jgi:transposase